MATSKIAIANRALQKCGVAPTSRIASFTEDSKEAAEIAQCYDTLRKAELRRNFWTFAIKRAVGRSIQSTDKSITPPTWGVGVTYDANDIVVSSGAYYISLAAANLGNAVTNTTYWAVYYGTLTAVVYDSTIAWYAGEIIIDGSNVWLLLTALAAAETLTEGTNAHQLAGTGAVTLTTTVRKGPVWGRVYAFVKPRDFLRFAPSDPRCPSSIPDWLVETDTIITNYPGPYFFRFVRDEEDTTKFDPMFDEGLAGRIAMETCESLTQATGKLQNIAAVYNNDMKEARLVNAIEAGTLEVDEDELWRSNW